MDRVIFEDLPSTNTPVTAENLNKMQDNIENAIESLSFDIIAKNSGEYGIDIDKYKYLYLFNCYMGEIGSGTIVLGGCLNPIPVVKTGVKFKSSCVEDGTTSYNAECQYANRKLIVSGTTINNMYPCVLGIY